MNGYLRIISIKGNPDYGPEPQETVIRMDRDSGSVLGNRHPLPNHMKHIVAERLKCIALFEQDLENEFAVDGPMNREIDALAQRVANGEQIVGACHCKPSQCHLDGVEKRVMERARIKMAMQ